MSRINILTSHNICGALIGLALLILAVTDDNSGYFVFTMHNVTETPEQNDQWIRCRK